MYDLTPPEGADVSIYPSDVITVSIIHTHLLPRVLHRIVPRWMPEARVSIHFDANGRMHVKGEDA